MTTTKRGFTQAAWDFFCSLKLSIFLLICLATTSIIGTVIPQSPQREYLERLSETKIRLYSTLGFFDMYHSWWFMLLLYLLTVNLMACSIKRLPRVWKFISEPNLVMDEGLEKTLSLTHEFKKQGDAASLRDKMATFLKSEFAQPVVTERDGELPPLCPEKSLLPPGRLCGPSEHHHHLHRRPASAPFSVTRRMCKITEGTSASTVYSQRGEKPLDLGFAVRCEKFTVSFYDTGAPKEFKSILTVLENGQPVPGYENIPIVVNDPLTYKGITFYQSSYGPAGEGGVYKFTVRRKGGGAPANLIARKGERVSLPGGGFMQVIDATQDVKAVHAAVLRARGQDRVRSPHRAHPSHSSSCRIIPTSTRQRGGDLIFTYDGCG